MVLIWEYRIPMPMTVEEYQVAQLYSVAQASINETGGGEGIEVVKNEPFGVDEFGTAHNMPDVPLLGGKYTQGQYTHKIYHLQSKVPAFIRMIAPSGSLDITEKAWNGYPYCRTVVTNPEYMKDNFIIKIESLHVADAGDSHNVHMLPAELLNKREVINIDIANNERISRTDYKPEWDPSNYKSVKTGRGPLNAGNWKDTTQPIMTCYKLVTCKFKWFGLQNRVEKFIMNTERRIFTNFHRQVFCWTDEWYGMTMKDIRDLEEKTKEDLEQQIKQGTVRGTKGTDED